MLIVGAILAFLATLLWVFNPAIENQFYFGEGEKVITIFAAVSALVGLVLVIVVRFLFASNIDVAAAVTWSMLGNFLGLGFAAISDIWINGYSPATAIVGEFLPAAGPNMIFAAILVPILVVAYAALQRQTGR